MTIRYLVDNSVIQRLRNPVVRDAWDRLIDRGEIATCLPLLLEAGYSARSARDHAALLERERQAKVMLEPAAAIVRIAVSLQAALFARGAGRAVGVSDLQIAATALHYSSRQSPVVVVHYDSDFDRVAAVEPRFRSAWIVPRGSIRDRET